MRTIKFYIHLTLPAAIVFCAIAAATLQQARAMNHSPSSFVNGAGDLFTQDGSAQSGSGTVQANVSRSEASGLANYADKPISSIPSQSVSMRYVVEHRSALNGKTITVRGVVARIVGSSTGNVSTGEQSMANPQPRIFVADNTRKRRDKNLDLIVLLREGEQGYSVGQKVTLRVRVDSNKIAVVMHKVS